MPIVMLDLQRSTGRLRTRKPKPTRGTPREELKLLRQELTLEFRGKHVLRARTIALLADRCMALPGLAEAAERLVDFFDDIDNGNWVDGSELFRLARADHLNRLKRTWRDFETRRSTLRQFLGDTPSHDVPPGCIRFKLPPARLETVKGFGVAFRNLISRLERICQLVLQSGFRVTGLEERSTQILLEAESKEVLDFAEALLDHQRWRKAQSLEVRTLEERTEISHEYADAARSLAAAQARHLSVLVEESVRAALVTADAGVLRTASALALDYIGRLDAFDLEGAEVTIATPFSGTEEAA